MVINHIVINLLGVCLCHCLFFRTITLQVSNLCGSLSKVDVKARGHGRKTSALQLLGRPTVLYTKVDVSAAQCDHQATLVDWTTTLATFNNVLLIQHPRVWDKVPEKIRFPIRYRYLEIHVR